MNHNCTTDFDKKNQWEYQKERTLGTVKSNFSLSPNQLSGYPDEKSPRLS
jgi:hypothetical protein